MFCRQSDLREQLGRHKNDTWRGQELGKGGTLRFEDDEVDLRMSVLSRLAISALAGLTLVTGWGLYRAQAQVAVVVGERAMPAPIVEVVPVARPGWSWVPGHWVWRRGAWFWVKGHHMRGVVTAMPAPIVEVVPVRPSPAHIWVKGHHAWEGGRWVWRPGVWVRL
jgi:hypothetical protein